MKRFSSVVLATMLAAIAPGSSALAGGLECAMNEALSDKNIIGIPVAAFDHQFTVKPVKFEGKVGKTHTVTGTILYHGKPTKEDEVVYRIVKEGGTVKDVKFQVNGGEWKSFSSAMTKAVNAQADPDSRTKEQQSKVDREMYDAGKGQWQNALEFVIAWIGVRHC